MNNPPVTTTRPSATTIGELDIHMLNLQTIVAEIRASMITKADMQTLRNEIQVDMTEKFATKEELKVLETKVEASTFSNSIARWANVVTKTAAAAAAVIALCALIAGTVRHFDKIMALI